MFLAYFLLVFFPTMLPLRGFARTEGYFIMKVFGHIIVLFWIIVGLIASKTTIERSQLYIIFFIITFFGSVYFYATYNLWEIRNRPSARPQVQLLLNDTTQINTADTLIYIGKTNNHVFFYNSSPRNPTPFSITINMSDVKNYKVFKHVDWFRIP